MFISSIKLNFRKLNYDINVNKYDSQDIRMKRYEKI